MGIAVLRPRSAFGVADLRAEHYLEASFDGWRSTSDHPCFEIEGPFRAGWWRVHAHLRRIDELNHERVQADFRADFGDGFDAGLPLERIVWNGEINNNEIYFHLPRPARSLRFQPLNAPGSFEIERFDATRLSNVGSFVRAVHRKWRLLRDYQCTGRVLRKGLKLALTGRLGEVRRKIFKALPDTRRFNVEADAYVRSVTGMGRWRVPLAPPELKRLRGVYRDMPEKPLLAAILPVDRVAPHALIRIIETVLKQIYENCEMHFVFPHDAPAVQIKLADNYAQRFDPLRVHVANGRQNLDDALADVLSRLDAEHVVFLQAGFELTEEAFLHLMKSRLAHPEASLVLNSVPPPEEDTGPRLSSSLFRPGSAGQQIHLFRTEELRTNGMLPGIRQSRLPLGTEAARQFSNEAKAIYMPEVLAYPVSCLTPLAPYESDHELPGKPPRALLINGNIVGISGWDNLVFEFARGMHSLGMNVHLNAGSALRGDLLPPFQLPAVRPRKPGDLELLLSPPHLLEHNPHPAGCVIFTMWESDRLEPKWVKDLNRARLVLVPSRWAVESFRASGVTTPIDIVPLGYDSLTFHPNDEEPAVCTFGTAAMLRDGGMRKNTDRLLRAFEKAFPDEADVRLRVKITPKCDLSETIDPRIEILRKFLLPAELAEWYRSLSAYVNGSFAEGFGLHLIEAMACGRPVISTAYSAVTEYFDEAVGYPVAHRLVPADGAIYKGHWAELDEDDLVRAMREVYENTAEARTRGMRSSVRAQRFTWKEAGRRLLQVLEKHSGERLTI